MQNVRHGGHIENLIFDFSSTAWSILMKLVLEHWVTSKSSLAKLNPIQLLLILILSSLVTVYETWHGASGQLVYHSDPKSNLVAVKK